MYKLKPGVESFQVVDGPFENKKFFRGDLYRKEEIPPQEKHKFEEMETEKRGDGETEKQIADSPIRRFTDSQKPGTATERSKS